MFKQQEIILEAAPGLAATLKKYQWESSPKNWLELAEAKSQNFSVILPFVGAFSAGKSTLLNALIGTPLFPTNIDVASRTIIWSLVKQVRVCLMPLFHRLHRRTALER
mgnify:CR=1 FL=1